MSSIYYQEKGSGLPVILVHGFCETHRVWDLITDALSTDFRVIAIDLPGFGKSSPVASPHTLDDVAREVLNFLSHDLKLNSCVVLGHSMGGYVTLALADKNPNLCKGIGLIHSTAYADTDERKVSRNKVIEFVKAHGTESFVKSFIPPLFFDPSNEHIPALVELAAQTPATTIISYTEAMRDRPDRTSVIQTFGGPVFFLAGDKDTIMPLKSIQDQAPKAKNPLLSILKGVAHMGMVESPEGTLDSINRFLRLV